MSDENRTEGLWSKARYFMGVMLVALVTMTTTEVVTTAYAKATGYNLITWDELLPSSDLQALRAGPTSFLPSEGSSTDTISSPLTMKRAKPRDAYERALVSVGVRSEYNNKKIKLPGFIVPVDIQGEGETKTFFFVPYFGACLHLPPPPPNQIVYAKFAKGYKVSDLNQPYYIEATLHTEENQSNLVTSAYTATVSKIYPYDR